MTKRLVRILCENHRACVPNSSEYLYDTIQTVEWYDPRVPPCRSRFANFTTSTTFAFTWNRGIDLIMVFIFPAVFVLPRIRYLVRKENTLTYIPILYYTHTRNEIKAHRRAHVYFRRVNVHYCTVTLYISLAQIPNASHPRPYNAIFVESSPPRNFPSPR